MKKLLRYGMAAAVVAGAGIALTSASNASSVPAFLGQPQAPSDYPCFTNTWGRINNICGSTRRFCMSLPVTAGTHTVQVSAQGADVSHNVSCSAQGITWDFGDAGHTPTPVSLSTFPNPQLLNLGTFSLPSNAYLYACCDVASAPGTLINSVIY